MATKTKAKAPAARATKKAAPVKATKKTVAPKAKKKPTRKSVIPSTEFMLSAPDANEVYLTGDFNDWATPGHKARRFKDGVWKKMLKLKPGRYEYLFLVDGQWWTDPENHDTTTNPFGSENSVCSVG